MVVPPFGCELIESSPSTNRRRSCILVKPSPVLFIALSCIKTCTEIADSEVNLSRASPTGALRSVLPRYASWHCAGLLGELGTEKEKVRLANL